MRLTELIKITLVTLLLASCAEPVDHVDGGTIDCNDEANAGNPACPPSLVDDDSDGVAAELDCDDQDPNLGARDADLDCDGHLNDDDCDPTDPASTSREQDLDCDGHLNDDDCNDEDPTIYPGAEEDWTDGIDSDCDGNADSVCGDGLLGNIEECDDGGTEPNDGCSASCLIEPWCTGGCSSNADCSPPETCIGRPAGIPEATGRCQNSSETHPGAESSCSPTEPCAENLVCSGEYRWGSGRCVPDWFAKTFHSYDDVDIPDDGSALRSPQIVCALATVPVDIVVTLHLEHPRPEDLVIRLENPQGEQGTVLNLESWSPGQIAVSVGSGDDAVNGRWALEVTDTVTGEQGKLLGWSLYLVSNFD